VKLNHVRRETQTKTKLK